MHHAWHAVKLLSRTGVKCAAVVYIVRQILAEVLFEVAIAIGWLASGIWVFT